MLAYVDQQLDTEDKWSPASVVSIDNFITMMAKMDRLDEAAHMLGYLEEINEFGALAARTLVADAAARITASTNGATEAIRAAGRRLRRPSGPRLHAPRTRCVSIRGCLVRIRGGRTTQTKEDRHEVPADHVPARRADRRQDLDLAPIMRALGACSTRRCRRPASGCSRAAWRTRPRRRWCMRRTDGDVLITDGPYAH